MGEMANDFYDLFNGCADNIVSGYRKSFLSAAAASFAVNDNNDWGGD